MQRVGPDPVQWQTIPGSSGDGDITYGRRGFRDRQVVFSKTYNVENDCLLHFLDGLCRGSSCCNTARKIRTIGWVIPSCFFYDNWIFHDLLSFSPACFKILFKVPFASSCPRLPAMVTRPFFTGCLNCLWLPFVETRYHPSLWIRLMASLTFIQLVIVALGNYNFKNPDHSPDKN